MTRWDVQNAKFKLVNAKFKTEKKHKFNAIRVALIDGKLYETDGKYHIAEGHILYNKDHEIIGQITKMFDSRKEAHQYISYTKDPDIIIIECQPRFELQPMFKKNGVTYRSIVYVADFRITYKDGHEEIIDTKGFSSREFVMKQKMFEYKYNNLTLKVI